MFGVNVLASGSKGNCTLLSNGDTKILLDAGINFGTLQRALNFENPTAVFLTHEHSDHVNKSTLAELLKRGVEVYMTRGTAEALKLEPRHNLKYIPINSKFQYSGCQIDIAKVPHDAAEPVNFDIWYEYNKDVAYITDTGRVPLATDMPTPSYLVIEANHDAETLLAADIDEHQKQRILNNHLSIQKLAEYLGKVDKTFLQEVHLIHISKRHGKGEKFRQIVQNIVGNKIKVFAH